MDIKMKKLLLASVFAIASFPGYAQGTCWATLCEIVPIPRPFPGYEKHYPPGCYKEYYGNGNRRWKCYDKLGHGQWMPENWYPNEDDDAQARAAGLAALRAAFQSLSPHTHLGPAVLHIGRPWKAERMPIAVHYPPTYDPNILPPARFDHEYNGTMFVNRVDDLEVKQYCARSGSRTACASIPTRPGGDCTVYIVYDDILNVQRMSYDAVFRHERAHCVTDGGQTTLSEKGIAHGLARMKKTLLTGIAALLLVTGAAHANISSISIPRTIFVLWVQEATTKDFVWEPSETFETLQKCMDEKKKISSDPVNSRDAHGFTKSFKCVRYRR
jgi:hypothetical protein